MLILRKLIGYVFKKTIGKSVLSGPFKGMRYVSSGIGGAYYPRILGTYELELHPIIEMLCSVQFEMIINVGAAEGYYAIGLALRNPTAEILAFEMNAKGRRLIEKMARINKVAERIKIYGLCSSDLLSNVLSKSRKTLIVMDVEGEENVLLDPKTIPALREAHVLVELHDAMRPEITNVISERFQSSHEVVEVSARARTICDLPSKLQRGVLFLPKRWRARCMDEWREGAMKWFYLKPKMTMAKCEK